MDFYDIQQYNIAKEKFNKEKGWPENDPFSEQIHYTEHIDYMVRYFKNHKSLFQKKYQYYKIETRIYEPYYPKGIWKQTGISDDYTKLMPGFYVIWDNFDSAEAILISEKVDAKTGYGKVFTHSPITIEDEFELKRLRRRIVRLFGFHLEVVIGGVPTQVVNTSLQSCKEMRNKLMNTLQQAGNWDVTVGLAEDNVFRVQLRSHSDKEFYYKDKNWWKALLEIEFVQDDQSPHNCSKIKCRLYESVVCPAPINDDPEAPGKGRSACFNRIQYGSDAEFKLADRVSSFLRSAFGIQ